MEISSLMNTNACTAQLRTDLSGTAGTPGWFRIGGHEVAPGASVVSCGVAGVGDQRNGGRVSAGGEDV